MKKVLYTLLAVAALTACTDENNFYVDPVAVVDFEDARLGTDGYIWGKSLAEEIDDEDWMGNPIKSLYYYGPVYAQHDAVLMTYFNDFGGQYDVWNGFVISSRTDRETAGFTNDKSVYAESGDAGSKQFAVAFYSAFTDDNEGIPTIAFAGGVRPRSIAIANTTYLYLYSRFEPGRGSRLRGGHFGLEQRLQDGRGAREAGREGFGHGQGRLGDGRPLGAGYGDVAHLRHRFARHDGAQLSGYRQPRLREIGASAPWRNTAVPVVGRRCFLS